MCVLFARVYPYLSTHCLALFGDRERESARGKADTTIALQVRFIRHVAEKETPRTSCPAAGIDSCVFNQVWKEAMGKDGPDQLLTTAPWLCACSVLDLRVTWEGCEGGQ